jgi:hypothetical protein
MQITAGLSGGTIGGKESHAYGGKDAADKENAYRSMERTDWDSGH